MKETEAVTACCTALDEIEDADARARVLGYLAARYGDIKPLVIQTSAYPHHPMKEVYDSIGELLNIAKTSKTLTLLSTISKYETALEILLENKTPEEVGDLWEVVLNKMQANPHLEDLSSSQPDATA